MVLLKIYFFSEFFFLTIVNALKWHTGMTFNISQKNCTHVWKIYEIPPKIGVFPNFEGLNDKKVFLTRAKINPWGTTFPLHSGKVRGQIWTFLKLKLEMRWVLKNWGKTEAFRCFLRKWKSVKNWLRYKQFSDFPNSKIFAGMLKKLAAQLSHCAAPSTRRDMRFSVFTNNI